MRKREFRLRSFSMTKPRLVVLGGCHVNGYPVGAAHAFPTVLNEAVGSEAFTAVPHVGLLHLPKHVATVDALRPSHAVFQLGNYESTACLQTLWRHARRAFCSPGARLGRAARAPGERKARRPPGGAGTGCGEQAASTALPTTPERAESRPVQGVRVAAAAVLLAGVWLLSARYRRSFRALGACVRRHPDTAFVFLSPLPNLSAPDNALRRLGGWFLRHRLPRAPNVRWLDAQAVLGPRPALFADRSHLNARGHAQLAAGLAAAYGVPALTAAAV